MSVVQVEIPPLFVELNLLHRNDSNQYVCWKEKARWIRFEEQAEEVLGRWSKPHVATIPHTSIDELRDLLLNGIVLLNTSSSGLVEIIDTMANELLGYFKDLNQAKMFAELMFLPFMHHHEKKIKKTPSGSSLNNNTEKKAEFQVENSNLNFINSNDANFLGSNLFNNNSKNGRHKLKYQYSFTETINADESSRSLDFKENTKFKKKVHTKSEGASILVMPLDFVQTSKLLFMRLQAPTEIPGFCEVKLKSRFIVLLLGPIERKIQLYEIGRAMSTCIADDICRESFYYAAKKQDIIDTLDQFNRNTMVIPPSEWNPKIRIEPPERFLSKEERKNKEISEFLHDQEITMESNFDATLVKTLRPFNGIIYDLKRKLPFYLSDFTDCFNLQSLATILYMYLVSLCTLVAFGGLFGQKTDNMMATIECILAGSICGILFSLFSGQPLNIISATGPVLMLESIIKSLCDKYELNFMELRLWIGLWTSFFLLLLAIFNLSFLVKYITRFTEDCFATLVAIVFIIDAFKSVANLRKTKIKASSLMTKISNNTFVNNSSLDLNENITFEWELAEAKQDSSFYFSFILFLTSFVLCVSLQSFKKKPYLPTRVRNFLSDFSVLIAIVLTSFIDYYMGVNTLKLIIPSKFQPTLNRAWLIPFFAGSHSFFLIPIAIIPALIATILIFMDQQITAVIANRKELKLKKSHGYHLDLLVIAFCIFICSVLGLPWFVAATVLTLTHINSLRIMSENTAPGEKPVYMGIREQRGSTFIMSILIGLSVFLTQVLSHIPMSALYGVFLFMGVSALNGMQFTERVLILFMPSKYQPDLDYLRHVNTKRVHIFTIIQLVSTGVLYLIKFIDLISLSFPILIVATCGIRKMLDFIFSQEELFWLDDILPGKSTEIIKDEKGYLKNLISEEPLKSKQEIESHRNMFLSNSTNSYYDFENENDHQIAFIDSNPTYEDKLYSHPSPVKFSTHFNHILEDDVQA